MTKTSNPLRPMAKVDSPMIHANHLLKPTAITLFSGVGGSSLALRNLGHEVITHDFDRAACASLYANGFSVVQGDVREVDFTDSLYKDVTLVEGGPPCQPFSQGGRNAGQNDPRDMIPEMQRCIAQVQPKFFILENVRGLASPRHSDYLNLRIAEFAAMGYHVEAQVLDAAHYGVPQSRKRLFILGKRVDQITVGPWEPPAIWWPERYGRAHTMARALGWTRATTYERNQMAPEAARVAFDDPRWMWPHQRPSTTVVGSFRPDVQAAPGFRSAGDGPRQNAPGSVVTTVKERLILQGLPEDWKVAGSKAAVDLQIGNSVPMPLIQALASANR